MDSAPDKLPRAGERWHINGGRGSVIITALYHPEVRCPSPYNVRPDVTFIDQRTGMAGSMALKAFLMAHTFKEDTCTPGEGDDHEGYNDKEYDYENDSPYSLQDKSSAPDERSSDALKKWIEKDSRRFSHYEK